MKTADSPRCCQRPRRWVGLLFAAIAAFGACPAVADDRALLIGINTYDSAKIRPLKGAVNDVTLFKRFLTKTAGFREDQIRELTNADANRAHILTEIDDWLIGGTAAGDRVVLFFSGHGFQADDGSADEADHQDEALIVFDSQDKRPDTWILDDELDAKLARLRDRSVLAVFDSCHSGTVTRDPFVDPDAKTPGWDEERVATRGDPSPQHQQEGNLIAGGGNIIALFAAAPNQLTFEDKSDPERPIGVFTKAFVDGAEGAADTNQDGHVTFGEVIEHARSSADRYCATGRRGRCALGLTPTYELDERVLLTDVGRFGRGSAPSVPVTAAEPLPTGLAVQSLLTHGNTAGLSLAIQPGTRLKLGDPMAFHVRSRKSGTLLLVDINAEGKMTQLFPSAMRHRSKTDPAQVRAGAEIIIPDITMGLRFTAQKPFGEGKLVAVLIEDSGVETDQLIIADARTSFVDIDQPVAWATTLRTRLDQLFHEADGRNRAIRWSSTVVRYSISQR